MQESGVPRGEGQEKSVDKAALYERFRFFAEIVGRSDTYLGYFQNGVKTDDFQALLDVWFDPAEQAVLKEDAQKLAPDQPEGAPGFWIW
jgi:hypothetical protein